MCIACYRTQVLSDTRAPGRAGSAADPLGGFEAEVDFDAFYGVDDDEEEDGNPETEAEDEDPLATTAPAGRRRYSATAGAGLHSLTGA